MPNTLSLQFNNRFARLPEAFFARVAPTPLQGLRMVAVSQPAAGLLDLTSDMLHGPDALAWFGGLREPPGSEPLAMLYAGHQFGHFVPQLGDGRAILLGGVANTRGEYWEIQLKGAGLTPFSRDGDGRAVLRSSIREYLCSEAMHALGIPTTRALCLLASDEEVYRERIEAGAVLARLAPSHVRFGSFEVFYYRGQYPRIRELADYVLTHHYPMLADSATPYHDLLREVILRTARLVAQWQLVGFTHGVLNTDNMSILGLTLDYGPYGFMDAYDAGFVCNHSDHHGRYAFDRQPGIGLWNLSCLAQALLPLLDEDGEQAAAMARELLALYEPELITCYARGMRAKLGLHTTEAADQALAAELLDLMQADQIDFTNLFRALGEESDARLRNRFIDRGRADAWLGDWRARQAREGIAADVRQAAMHAANPRFILRNYLAQQVIAAAEQEDFGPLEHLHQVLQRPFDEQPENAAYAAEPPDWARGLNLSCSS